MKNLILVLLVGLFSSVAWGDGVLCGKFGAGYHVTDQICNSGKAGQTTLTGLGSRDNPEREAQLATALPDENLNQNQTLLPANGSGSADSAPKKYE